MKLLARYCLILILAGYTIPAFSQQDSPPPPLSREQAATDIVNNMASNNFEAARKDFAYAFKEKLSAEKMYDVWQSVTEQIGNFEKVISTTSETSSNGYIVIKKRCKFAYDNYNVKVTFNDDNKVIGLFMKP